jgi:hypothetical protein
MFGQSAYNPALQIGRTGEKVGEFEPKDSFPR